MYRTQLDSKPASAPTMFKAYSKEREPYPSGLADSQGMARKHQDSDSFANSLLSFKVASFPETF